MKGQVDCSNSGSNSSLSPPTQQQQRQQVQPKTSPQPCSPTSCTVATLVHSDNHRMDANVHVHQQQHQQQCKDASTQCITGSNNMFQVHLQDADDHVYDENNNMQSTTTTYNIIQHHNNNNLVLHDHEHIHVIDYATHDDMNRQDRMHVQLSTTGSHVIRRNSHRNVDVNGSTGMNFVDETTKVQRRIKKKQDEGSIKRSKLRKSLTNDQFLENYFEYDTTTGENQLKRYKLIENSKTKVLTAEVVPTLSNVATALDSTAMSETNSSSGGENASENTTENIEGINDEGKENGNTVALLTLLKLLTGNSESSNNE